MTNGLRVVAKRFEKELVRHVKGEVLRLKVDDVEMNFSTTKITTTITTTT